MITASEVRSIQELTRAACDYVLSDLSILSPENEGSLCRPQDVSMPFHLVLSLKDSIHVCIFM